MIRRKAPFLPKPMRSLLLTLAFALPGMLLLTACRKHYIYDYYVFDKSCNEISLLGANTCQPCNYMGPERAMQPVEFVDSATGATVTAQVLARPTFFQNTKTEQKQQCYYKALQIGGTARKLEISADAKEGLFVVILNEDRYEISPRDLTYRYTQMPPLSDSAVLFNMRPKHPEARLQEAWMAQGLGLIRLRYRNDDETTYTVLTKKYGN